MLGLKHSRGGGAGGGTGSFTGREIPGFSKWIAHEVYLEDKMAETALHNMATKMIENVDWINAAMDAVWETDGDDVLLKSPMRADAEGALANDMEHLQAVPEAEEGDVEMIDDILAENEDSDLGNMKETSLFIEKAGSELKYEKETRTKSVKDSASELDYRIGSADVHLDGTRERSDVNNKENNDTDSAIPSVQEIATQINNIPNERAFRESTVIRLSNVSDEFDKVSLINPDDSFELIKRDIRKSFALKQKIQAVIESEDNPLEAEKTTEIRAAEEELKELSRLIEREQSESDSESDEGSTQKQEQVQVQYQDHGMNTIDVKSPSPGGVRTSPVAIASEPIKFSEMPLIEPLQIEKRTGVVIKKVRKISTSSNILENRAKELSIFDGKGTELNIKPLPNVKSVAKAMMLHEDTEDEPTIKVRRRTMRERIYSPHKSKQEREREREQEQEQEQQPQRVRHYSPSTRTATSTASITAATPIASTTAAAKSQHSDLLSRLMKPTQSSSRKSVATATTATTDPIDATPQNKWFQLENLRAQISRQKSFTNNNNNNKKNKTNLAENTNPREIFGVIPPVDLFKD